MRIKCSSNVIAINIVRKKLTIEDFLLFFVASPVLIITNILKISPFEYIVRLLSFLLSSQSISIIVFITMYPCAEENCVETEQLDSVGIGLILIYCYFIWSYCLNV